MLVTLIWSFQKADHELQEDRKEKKNGKYQSFEYKNFKPGSDIYYPRDLCTSFCKFHFSHLSKKGINSCFKIIVKIK